MAAAPAARDTILEPEGCETRRRGGGGARPTTRAGLNRFAWDLRWPGASTFPCMILWSANAEQGPLALPGTYRVRVTAWQGAAAPAVAEQALVVRADPRLVGVTDADRQAQFDLLVQIRDRVSAANDAVRRIRTLRSAIAARTAGGGASGGPSGAVVRAGEAAAARLRALEEELYQVRNRSGQDPLNFPIRLNNRLAALGRSVATGEARPTDASHVVFRELSAELDDVLRRLDAVVAGEVRAFERLATAQGLPARTAGAR